MSTITETAITTYAEDLAEIMTHFFFLEIDCSKSFNTRSINDSAAIRQEIHLRESGGVHARIVRIGYLSSPRQLFAEKRIQQRALAYA